MDLAILATTVWAELLLLVVYSSTDYGVYSPDEDITQWADTMYSPMDVDALESEYGPLFI